MSINEQKLLGLRIKRVREERKLTQEKVCEVINIDITTLSNLENGKHTPSFATIVSLIKYFQIEPNLLLDFIKYQHTENDTLDLLILEHLQTLSPKIKKKVLELLELV
ncbi:MAG: helix-turn-helix domain-containing protein [Candidatus Gastranaerophilales bacterium]|nr:helix-turn-helix domain-containing protein [Candidatus Gastranaerophilales bacterium]